MATTTTNFGWDIPQSTDLVKDGATAIAALGQDIDTALVDLKGGTTGQVLAKATNTDLDFTWVAQDDSNAIQNAIVDAKGDLIAATANDTPARLGVGTNGQVLTADSTAATGLVWATPAGGGGMTTLASGSFSTSTNTLTLSSISGSYKDLFLVVRGWKPTSGQESRPFVRFNNISTNNYSSQYQTNSFSAAQYQTGQSAIGVNDTNQNFRAGTENNASYFGLYIQDYANAITNKFCEIGLVYYNQAQVWTWGTIDSRFETTSAISRIDITTNNGTNFGSEATYILYGVN